MVNFIIGDLVVWQGITCTVCKPENLLSPDKVWIDNPDKGYKHWVDPFNLKHLVSKASHAVKNPYTSVEEEIMDNLTSAFNLLNSLPLTHPCHLRDFSDGIHKCQDVIIHRVVQRDYPNTFPTHSVDIKPPMVGK
jgi:hypothetical protein